MGQRRLLFAVVALVVGLFLVARCSQSGEDADPADTAGGSPQAVDVAGPDGRPDTGADTGDQADPAGPAPSGPGQPATAPAPPDESALDDGPLPEGTSASGPAQPEAIAAADRFARAWVRNDSDWSDRLAELATPELARTLREADPATVPAAAVTGPGDVLSEVPGWASVGIPTDAGTLVLHVVRADDRWLVSAIDWRPRW